MQADAVSSASGSVPDFQEPLRTWAMPDSTGRPDLVRLVASFHEKVRADPQLGHGFEKARDASNGNPPASK